jgi:hypothetical protein
MGRYSSMKIVMIHCDEHIVLVTRETSPDPFASAPCGHSGQVQDHDIVEWLMSVQLREMTANGTKGKCAHVA